MKFGEQPKYSRRAYEENEKGIQDVKDIAKGSGSVEELRTLVREKKALEAQKVELYSHAWDEANEMNKEQEALAQESAAQAKADANEVERIRAEILGENGTGEIKKNVAHEQSASQPSVTDAFPMTGEAELNLSVYEQEAVSRIRDMMKSDDFSGVFKRIIKEQNRADKQEEAASDYAGFFKKLIAPKADAVCNMEKLEDATKSLLESRLKEIIAADDIDTYKRYVSAADNNEYAFDRRLHHLSQGLMDFESVGPKIQEFNFRRAKDEIASFDQFTATVHLEDFVEGRADMFGNGDPDFRKALLGSKESRKQFQRLVKFLNRPNSGAFDTQSRLRECLSKGYLSRQDVEKIS